MNEVGLHFREGADEEEVWLDDDGEEVICHQACHEHFGIPEDPADCDDEYFLCISANAHRVPDDSRYVATILESAVIDVHGVACWYVTFKSCMSSFRQSTGIHTKLAELINSENHFPLYIWLETSK